LAKNASTWPFTTVIGGMAIAFELATPDAYAGSRDGRPPRSTP